MGKVLVFVIAIFFFLAAVSGWRIPRRNHLLDGRNKELDDVDVPFRDGKGPEKISFKLFEINELKSKEGKNENTDKGKSAEKDVDTYEDNTTDEDLIVKGTNIGEGDKYLESDVDEETISKAEKIANEDLLNGLNRILKNNETLEDVFRAENVYGFPS